MSPPWARAMSRAMARPRPEPPVCRLRPSSRRWKGRKASSRRASGMPGPSSSTAISAKRSSRVTVTFTWRPNFSALSIRLVAQRRSALRFTLNLDGPGASRSTATPSPCRARPPPPPPRRAPARQIVQRRFLAAFAAREFEIFVEHVLHLGDVGAHRLDVGALRPSSPAASFMRVSGVFRSWLTPASISVRCCTWRSMRSRMVRKACAARRTSVAP